MYTTAVLEMRTREVASTNKALDLGIQPRCHNGQSNVCDDCLLALGDLLWLPRVVQVILWDSEQSASDPWRVWKLTPVQVSGPPTGLDGKEEAPPGCPVDQ